MKKFASNSITTNNFIDYGQVVNIELFNGKEFEIYFKDGKIHIKSPYQLSPKSLSQNHIEIVCKDF